MTLYYLAAAVFVALSAADLLLTLKLQRLGAVERNPLLGKHPKPAVLIAFATVTTALWTAAGLWLAAKQAPGVAAVFVLGVFLRCYVIAKGLRVRKELRK
jgi:hypothetical protein